MKIPIDLSERFEAFAAEVIKGIAKIQRNFAGRHIAGQLIRSATSAGANYEEACGAESRQDFIHKLQIVFERITRISILDTRIFKGGFSRYGSCSPTLKGRT